MSRQTTPPAQHDQLPAPEAPFTDEELDVQHTLGRGNGDAVVSLVRSRDQQVIHVTTPPQTIYVEGRGGVAAHEGIDVLVAFILAVATLLLGTWVLNSTTDLQGWDLWRWGSVIGLGVGFLYLAASNGIRQLRG